MELASQQTAEYTHEPLDDAANQIRLLQIAPGDEDEVIACEISVWDRNAAPSYAAISYTWGDPKETRNIFVNERFLEVRFNCQYALWQARLQGFGYIWMDFVCINQTDAKEKSRQVARMFDVYKNASHVLACIGLHDETSPFLYAEIFPKFERFMTDADMYSLFRDRGSMSSRCEPLESWMSGQTDDELLRLWDHSDALGRRNYWERLWILQELFAGGFERVSMLCGHSITSFGSLFCLAKCQRVITWAGVVRVDYRGLWEKLNPESGSVIHSRLERFAATLSKAPFDPASIDWLLLRDFRCQDVHDRLYGILGLVDWPSPALKPKPDYGKTIAELLREMAGFTGHLDNLHSLIEHLHADSHDSKDCKSLRAEIIARGAISEPSNRKHYDIGTCGCQGVAAEVHAPLEGYDIAIYVRSSMPHLALRKISEHKYVVVDFLETISEHMEPAGFTPPVNDMGQIWNGWTIAIQLTIDEALLLVCTERRREGVQWLREHVSLYGRPVEFLGH